MPINLHTLKCPFCTTEMNTKNYMFSAYIWQSFLLSSMSVLTPNDRVTSKLKKDFKKNRPNDPLTHLFTIF